MSPLASLLINGQIELLQDGIPSTLPACAGAVFYLGPGYDLGMSQPVVDLVGQLVLDGSRPIGTRADNRTVSLPIVIQVPPSGNETADVALLTAARETLLALINSQTFTLTWTRDGGLPLIFDCFRANAAVIQYSVRRDRSLVSLLTISFQALPYGRSDTYQLLSFASPLSGGSAPPSAVAIDDYETIQSGNSGWSLSNSSVSGSHSAEYAAVAAGGPVAAPTYKSTFTAKNITGRGVLQHWLGVTCPGGGNVYGPGATAGVTLTYTLKDSAGHTVSFGTTVSALVSLTEASPAWSLVSANLPSSLGSFSPAALVEADVKVSNFGATQLNGLNVFLDALTAQASTSASSLFTRGALYTLHGVIGTSHAPLNLQFQQPPATTPTVVTLTTPGAVQFIPPAGVTSLTVEKWAASAAGGTRTTAGQSSGSKGGEYTKNTAFACTPGVPINGSIGAGGVPSTSAPTDGGDTWFGANDSTAAHGSVAPAVNVSTAVNTAHGVSTDPLQYAGGAPASGSSSGGGGGGESGGPSGTGNAGSGTAGGTGHADAGDGGAGGVSGASNGGSAGIAPGGGAGGANSIGGTVGGGHGASGQIRITYTAQQPLFTTLIAHRPGVNAPANLTPFVSTTNVTDPPDGRLYPVTSQVSGQNARFAGTYTMIAVANSWNNPTASRTLTLTAWQQEYPGGPYSSQSVSRTFVPSTDVVNGLVPVGEMTLPVKDIPPDNTAAAFYIGITDTNTSDQYLDVLMIDTSGQTVTINPTGAGYAAFLVDEPTADRDTGRISGTAYDRTTAVSVLGDTFVSGGPLVAEPGDCSLFLYSPQGAPALAASFAPRWFAERLA